MEKQSRSLWAWFRWLPFSEMDQALFAETVSQALDAGIAIDNAILLGAKINPSLRLRDVLNEMAMHCQSGWDLETSLTETGATLGDGLKAAFQVGEDRGCLSTQLSLYARKINPQISNRLAESLNRSAEVTQFAKVLASLLSDRRLTLDLVEDAARVAASEKSQFLAAIQSILDNMQNGKTFPESLECEKSVFDVLFVTFVQAATNRQDLRAILARLGATAPSQNQALGLDC